MILKFRAFDKKTSKIYGVGLLDYYHDVAWLDDVIEDECVTVATRKLSEIELMQSTGLFDKNGKEIFEGDIIGSKDGLLNGVVLYRSDLAMWTVDLIRYNNFERLCNVASSREIIGNIHENQDLLEEKE